MDVNKLTKDEIIALKATNPTELLSAKQASLSTSTITKAAIGIKDKCPLAQTLSSVDSKKQLDYVDVSVVANVANYMHYNGDVIPVTTYDKVIARNSKIAHLVDHKQSLEGVIGEVQSLYTKEMKLSSLGGSSEQKVTALVMDSRVKKNLNEKAFTMYSDGSIDQHSIGYGYVRDGLQLAVNSDKTDVTEEYAVWQEHFPTILNKQEVIDKGYFWLVTDMNLYENSAVLFGANPYTPTLNLPTENVNLSNRQHIPSTTHKGNIMTNEETLQQLVEAQAQLATLKASQNLEVAKTIQEERKRVLAINEAKQTFGIDDVASIEAIDKGFSLDMVTSMFTAIKAASDRATNVNTSGSSLSGMTPAQLKAFQDAEALKTAPNSFEAEIALGLKHLGEQQPIFKGIS